METDWSSTDNRDTLYHYTKIDKALEHILYQRQLKFSTGINTNDPREYRKLDLSPHSDGGYSDEEFRYFWRELEKSLAKCRSQYKYGCFCLNDKQSQGSPKVPGYARLRMWAQYGQNFYGVCIAFSAECLQKRISETATAYAKPVCYVDLEHIDTALSDINVTQLIGKNTDDWAESYMRDDLNHAYPVNTESSHSRGMRDHRAKTGQASKSLQSVRMPSRCVVQSCLSKKLLKTQ